MQEGVTNMHAEAVPTLTNNLSHALSRSGS